MLEKEKLRKADVYSGIVIFLFGAWIVWQASKMPMKDSWGGVQNVWFVSPALFPLFIGAIIMLLGLLLFRTALKTIGMQAFGDTLQCTENHWHASIRRHPAMGVQQKPASIFKYGVHFAVLCDCRPFFGICFPEHTANRFFPERRSVFKRVYYDVLLR
jgi:hypothetical protein